MDAVLPFEMEFGQFVVFPEEVEDAGASRPTQDQFLQTAFPNPPSPLHLDVARRPTPAAGYPPPPPPGPFWSHDTPTAECHQSHPSVGLGMTDLWVPASACSCASLPAGTICVHRLRSLVPWDEGTIEAGYHGEGDVHNPQPVEGHLGAVNDLFGPFEPPPRAHDEPFMNPPSQSDLSNGEQGRAQHTTRPAYDPHSPMPLTPLSPAYLTTPGSSGASTSRSPESVVIPSPTSSPRKRRQQPSARRAPRKSSRNQANMVSSMEPDDAEALKIARDGVRTFVEHQPHTLEPSIGDPAATTIIGFNQRLGIPGSSLYSIFFSSCGGKPPFTCLDCGRVEGRLSRAVRHQRQHFDHRPFQCQGTPRHPPCNQWFASEEYATDHAKKAGSPGFPCPHCPAVFSNSGNLGRHKRLVHQA